MLFGNWFHSIGPLTLKALAAKVSLLTLGVVKLQVFDLSDLRPILLTGNDTNKSFK